MLIGACDPMLSPILSPMHNLKVRTGESTTIVDAHPDGSINSIEFDGSGEVLLTCGGFDRKVSIWHNVYGNPDIVFHFVFGD